jgi:hypothetical protein
MTRRYYERRKAVYPSVRLDWILEIICQIDSKEIDIFPRFAYDFLLRVPIGSVARHHGVLSKKRYKPFLMVVIWD